MQQVRVASRRKYTPEEKVRIVLEGFRREVAVNELCRREGIKPGDYYAWTKDFMEAGKERLTRDTVRDATHLCAFITYIGSGKIFQSRWWAVQGSNL
jgi:transposase